jgi:hypothetical protein
LDIVVTNILGMTRRVLKAQLALLDKKSWTLGQMSMVNPEALPPSKTEAGAEALPPLNDTNSKQNAEFDIVRSRVRWAI